MGRTCNFDRKIQGKKTTFVIWVHAAGMGTCGMYVCGFMHLLTPPTPRFLEKIGIEKQTKY
jgi:hypothetical protein